MSINYIREVAQEGSRERVVFGGIKTPKDNGMEGIEVYGKTSNGEVKISQESWKITYDNISNEKGIIADQGSTNEDKQKNRFKR